VNLKTAMVDLAKLYEDMQAKHGQGEWLFRTQIPTRYEEFMLAAADDNTKRPPHKRTANPREYRQIEYKTTYGPAADTARWWIDVGPRFSPSQNPPQITRGFKLSEIGPTSEMLAGKLDPVDRKQVSDAIEQLTFNNRHVSDKVIRGFLRMLMYFATKARNNGGMKQAFDPLPKFDICELAGKVLGASGLGVKIKHMKIRDILKQSAFGGKYEELRLDIKSFLETGKAGNSCRIVPADTSVFPIVDLPNNDWLVVMELRNPAGPCVELVDYKKLKVDPNNRDELDDDSLVKFHQCWKQLQT